MKVSSPPHKNRQKSCHKHMTSYIMLTHRVVFPSCDLVHPILVNVVCAGHRVFALLAHQLQPHRGNMRKFLVEYLCNFISFGVPLKRGAGIDASETRELDKYVIEIYSPESRRPARDL